MTQTQLAGHLGECVARIQPQADVAAIAQRIPRLLERAVPPRVLYTNYAIGECNDLIFGVSLVDYAQARGLADGDIPKIVRLCIQEVDARGLEAEGIYRVCLGSTSGSAHRPDMAIQVSGRHAVVQEVQLVPHCVRFGISSSSMVATAQD